MSYRKMYIHSFIFAIMSVIPGAITSSFGVNNAETMVLLEIGCYIAIMFISGYFGNKWYYNIVKQRVSEGYHTMPKFKPTSISLIFLNMYGIGAFLYYLADIKALKRSQEQQTTNNEIISTELTTDNIRLYLSKH